MEFFFICKECQRKFLHYKELKSHTCSKSKERVSTINPNLIVENTSFNNTLITKPLINSGTRILEQTNPIDKSSFNIALPNITLKQQKETTPITTHHVSCHICQKEFFNIYNLKIHVQIHSLNTGFACTVASCRDSFTGKKSFWKHMQEQHKDELIKKEFCKICKTSFMGYFRIMKLKEHISKPCSKEEFACTQCGKKLGTSYHLKCHTNIHEGKFDFECEDCDKKFASRASLTSHKVYNHTKSILFSCDQCEASFKEKHRLETHLRIHTGGKPFKCREGCEKNFRIYSTRISHERIHKGVRKHKCTFCPKTFMQLTQKIRHIKRHKGIKNYICQVCGKTFFEPADVRKCKHSGKN